VSERDGIERILDKEMEKAWEAYEKRLARQVRRIEQRKRELPEGVLWFLFEIEGKYGIVPLLTEEIEELPENIEKIVLGRERAARKRGRSIHVAKDLFSPPPPTGLPELILRSLGRCSAVAAKLGILLGIVATMCAIGGEIARKGEELVNSMLDDFAEALWDSCGLMSIEFGEGGKIIKKKMVNIEPFPVAEVKDGRVKYEKFTCSALDRFVSQVETWFTYQDIKVLRQNKSELLRLKAELTKKKVAIQNKLDREWASYKMLEEMVKEQGIDLTEGIEKTLERLRKELSSIMGKWGLTDEEKNRLWMLEKDIEMLEELERKDWAVQALKREYDRLSCILDDIDDVLKETEKRIENLRFVSYPRFVSYGRKLALGFSLRHVLYCGKKAFLFAYQLANLRRVLIETDYPAWIKGVEEAIEAKLAKLRKHATDAGKAGCPCFLLRLPRKYVPGRVPPPLTKMPERISKLRDALREIAENFEERMEDVYKHVSLERPETLDWAQREMSILIVNALKDAFDKIAELELEFVSFLKKMAATPLGIEKLSPVTREAFFKDMTRRLGATLKKVRSALNDSTLDEANRLVKAVRTMLKNPYFREYLEVLRESFHKKIIVGGNNITEEEEIAKDLLEKGVELRVDVLRIDTVERKLAEDIVRRGVRLLEDYYRRYEVGWRKMVGWWPPLEEILKASKSAVPTPEWVLEWERERAKLGLI